MTDEEREDWVGNDEGLYDAWQRSRMTMKQYIEANRERIDWVARLVTTGERRQHFTKYGG